MLKIISVPAVPSLIFPEDDGGLLSFQSLLKIVVADCVIPLLGHINIFNPFLFSFPCPY